MSTNSRINIMQIEANARAPYAREVLRLTNLNNELVDALRKIRDGQVMIGQGRDNWTHAEVLQAYYKIANDALNLIEG